MKFYQEMNDAASVLKKHGHEAITPVMEMEEEQKALASTEEMKRLKEEVIRKHANHIEQADAILVVNYTKNNIEGYIGANSFLEMGFAFLIRKPIYTLFDLPTQGFGTDELLGLGTTSLKGDINNFPKTLA